MYVFVYISTQGNIGAKEFKKIEQRIAIKVFNYWKETSLL